jgi:uncharacterized protein (TIGR02145 family)
MWWASHTIKNETNNLVNALKIPLAGIRYNGGVFGSRGQYTGLWSSTINDTSAYVRYVMWNNSNVYRNSLDQLSGYSVRCLKN